ncbi:hypothetical protein H6P81_014506 [Aristolochia fimbriata]|uniref:Uncharacterized protein n=1 Tax=Aristolochia fimbriata TaxID=158543 RepID=A0AAV7EHY5_ARIFI|nr:hypothetical protein H6P81_014506 [Aristolochia fimbriata]
MGSHRTARHVPQTDQRGPVNAATSFQGSNNSGEEGGATCHGATAASGTTTTTTSASGRDGAAAPLPPPPASTHLPPPPSQVPNKTKIGKQQQGSPFLSVSAATSIPHLIDFSLMHAAAKNSRGISQLLPPFSLLIISFGGVPSNCPGTTETDKPSVALTNSEILPTHPSTFPSLFISLDSQRFN